MIDEFGIIVLEEHEIDHLTEVANKKVAEERLEESLAQRASQEGDYSIIMFDIDYFKAINDLLSYTQGDEVLRDVGRILRFLESDIYKHAGLCGRVGGDEFLITLPYASGTEAEDLAAKIRLSVENHDFRDVNNNQSLEERITVTCGIDTVDVQKLIDIKTIDAEDLAKRMKKNVDQALSYGKLLGRNRVVQFNDRVAREMQNLNLTRRFYRGLRQREFKEIISTLDNFDILDKYSELKDLMVEDAVIMKKKVPVRDYRSQSIFADECYRKIRCLPCDDKNEILKFMHGFLN